MRYEFMNWVDWGIIVMDKDSAQRLLDRILSDSSRLPTKKVQKDEASVPAETPKSEQPGDSLGNPLLFSKSASLAESVAPGTRYRMFDMNGVYLRDGVWQGRFKAPGKPVIVRFSNGLTRVVK